MNQLLATLVSAVVLSAGMAGVDIVDGEATAFDLPSVVMQKLLSSPTVVMDGYCADCDACGAEKWEADVGQAIEGWSVQGCDWGEYCLVPCLVVGDNTLTNEQMRDVSDRVLSGGTSAGVDVIAAYPNAVRVNIERQSIQFNSCSGTLIANLPLTAEQFAAVLAQ
jgi:hypothetical protein